MNTNHIITTETVAGFERWLASEERSEGTIKKYVHDVLSFAEWNGSAPLLKDAIALWKEHLIDNGYSPTTINSMLAAINTYCRYAGLDFKVRFLRIQRKIFCEEN